MEYEHESYYEIVVKPHVDEKRSEYFEGLNILQLEAGETLISGYIQDQTKLFSVISRIRDMGLSLISVNRKGGR